MIDVRVPGDKSITHRALLFSALATGESRLTGLLDAADTRSTARVLRSLGADVPETLSGDVRVRGSGLRGFRSPGDVLDCGNSGTTARLLLGALAGGSAEAVLTGDASLRARPMRRVTGPLAAVGARFRELGEPDRLPIRVQGTADLAPIELANTRSSAQVKTAMLLAGLTAGVPVVVTETGRPRDHTERLLRAMGAPIRTREGESGATTVSLEPVPELGPLNLRVPGDVSSATFFLVLGALQGPIRARGVGLNPTRTGALEVMARMGVRVTARPTGEEAGEPVGDVVVEPGTMQGTDVAPDEIPRLLDEIPALSVLAARARGETRFTGVGELRVKESDRIDALARNLRALGVSVDDGADYLVVRGGNRPLEGVVDAFGDHRIAMAFGVLGALPGNTIRIRDADVAGISYPGFWDELARVQRAMVAA